MITTQIMLDFERRHQRIDHFGASGAWSFDPIAGWSAEAKNRLADLLFSQETGIGLSVWRFNFGGGSAPVGSSHPEPYKWRGHIEAFRYGEYLDYEWTAHAGQRWFLQAAKERGVPHFIAVVYTPPAWMTKNGKRSPDESSGTTNLKEGYEGQFAAYLADILTHFADQEGIAFEWISPFNEPSWSWNDSGQEGNRSSNEEIRKLARVISETFAERGIATEIDLVEAAEIPALLDDAVYRAFFNHPEHDHYHGHDCSEKYGGKYREYLQELLGDPETAALIGHKLSYHSYWADHVTENGLDRLVRLREVLVENLRRVNSQAKLWQTEYCNLNSDGNGRDLSMDFALFVARVIHCDLAVAGVSSWQWWLALSPHDYKDGLIYTDYRFPGDPETIIPSKTLWTLGQYSRFIRPGAVRIHTTALQAPEGLWVSAYVHDEDRRLSVVIVNEQETVCMLQLAGSNLTQELERYITDGTPGMDLVYQGKQKVDAQFSIPPRSVVTLTGAL
jgi:O-glycosyl hydrolase